MICMMYMCFGYKNYVIPDMYCLIMCFLFNRTADEEDELLYGDSDTAVFQSSFNMSQTSELERYTPSILLHDKMRNTMIKCLCNCSPDL